MPLGIDAGNGRLALPVRSRCNHDSLTKLTIESTTLHSVPLRLRPLSIHVEFENAYIGHPCFGVGPHDGPGFRCIHMVRPDVLDRNRILSPPLIAFRAGSRDLGLGLDAEAK